MREFTLDARLAACAAFVRPGSRLADIGTDHGYLPIRLLLDGVVPSAIAADIRPGPLSSAKENALHYGVLERMDCRLSDGLALVKDGEVDDITIAGMGGELILRILTDAPWACKKGMRLILQPMTMAPELRRGLLKLGMEITEEVAVSAAGRVYSVLCVEKNEKMEEHDLVWEYMGKLLPGGEESAVYACRVLTSLKAKEGGLRHTGDTEQADALLKIQEQIAQRYC
ncbi:MAG: SAM-dependent methyltransferase [Clostridia bacterium]|nr:SAM-dependent methyltransferase [Clostridia bacterium]